MCSRDAACRDRSIRAGFNAWIRRVEAMDLAMVNRDKDWLPGRQTPEAAYLGNHPIMRGSKQDYIYSHSREDIRKRAAKVIGAVKVTKILTVIPVC